MIILIISCLFWLLGIAMMLSSDFLQAKVRHAEKDLHHHADETKEANTSESVYMRILEKIVGSIPWFVIRIAMTIFGLFIIAMGFVVLAFYDV